ncbi:MAG: hypothetical protein ACREEP_13285 [Dongiaceae bacterium]
MRMLNISRRPAARSAVPDARPIAALAGDPADRAAAKPHLPANACYVAVKLTRVERAAWREAKTSIGG